MSAAVRVWGRADQYDLTFEQTENGAWQAVVPADHTDGRYACEIWAESATGEQAYWTGVLYTADSRLVCVYLVDDPYQVVLLPDRAASKLLDNQIHCNGNKGVLLCCQPINEAGF